MAHDPDSTQFDALLEAAQDAFWEVIAEAHPGITTGDFPPDSRGAFHEACRAALETWRDCNALLAETTFPLSMAEHEAVFNEHIGVGTPRDPQGSTTLAKGEPIPPISCSLDIIRMETRHDA